MIEVIKRPDGKFAWIIADESCILSKEHSQIFVKGILTLIGDERPAVQAVAWTGPNERGGRLARGE